MAKFRLTTARKAILEFLEESDEHFTPSQIYTSLTDRLPSLNRTTVYRCLDYLLKHGLISVADIGSGSLVYQRIQDTPHHHLVCLNCNEILQIDHKIVEPFFKVIENHHNFIIKTNHLVLYGKCKNCQ